jgi:hypothetical protein
MQLFFILSVIFFMIVLLGSLLVFICRVIKDNQDTRDDNYKMHLRLEKAERKILLLKEDIYQQREILLSRGKIHTLTPLEALQTKRIVCNYKGE